MIIGIGMDLSEAAFWSQALADPTTSVIEGTFTPAELADANAGPTPPADRLATRFAAKEAFTKAIGVNRFGQEPVMARLEPKCIEVIKDEWGRPALSLHGPAQDLANRFGVGRIWVSLTHEAGIGAAVVVLES